MTSRIPRLCEICTSSYRPNYAKQRTCGRACGVELRRREGTLTPPRRFGPVSKVYFPTCRVCSTVFTRRSKPTEHPVCPNPGCRLQVLSCHECDGFVVSHLVRKYCNSVCAGRAKRRADLARYGATPEQVDQPRQCRGCGNKIPQQRRLCDDCRTLKEREDRRKHKRRHRARIRCVPSEDYTLVEIAHRDGRRCGLCRHPVDMTLAVPHPDAPTIDHVLPLAAGGDNTRANVQLAHFLCNSKKGSGGSQQLALLG